MIASLSLARLAGAAAVVLAYLLMCGWVVLGVARERRAAAARAAQLAPAGGGKPVLVAFASQTGVSEELAWHTGRLLHTAGEAVQVLPLAQVDRAVLAGVERALFIVSTYGEGDPPDAGVPFARSVMAAAPDLSHLQYAVLALGDATYANYCGFGRALDGWLGARGARPQFDRIDVDRADSEAIARWQHHLGHIATLADAPAWETPGFDNWTLAVREHLNPGSEGQPVFHLELLPPADAPAGAPSWSSGDLVQVQPPADPSHAREYSIGSIAADVRVHLLVRRQLRADGTPGTASGWLTGMQRPHPEPVLPIGGTVPLRLRAHRNFRLGDNAALPLIFIGNGTGLAGLRGHLKARAVAGQRRNWLLFGERHEAHDFLYRRDIEGWKAAGILERIDLVFSRDLPVKTYVQDRLRNESDTVRAWLAQGAAIYVCGSLDGMAAGVDAALRDIAGSEAIDALAAAGRYRRDVY